MILRTLTFHSNLIKKNLYNVLFLDKISLREKCPYSELFWPVFSRIRTEYREILVSLRIQSECGKIRTRIIPSTDTFYAVYASKEK